MYTSNTHPDSIDQALARATQAVQQLCKIMLRNGSREASFSFFSGKWRAEDLTMLSKFTSRTA
jgi:hypothetical protein